MPSNCLQTTDWAHFLASHESLYQVHTNAHSVLGEQKGFPDFILPSEKKDYSFYRTKSSSQNNLDSNCSYCKTWLFKAMTLKSKKLHKTYQYKVYILTVTMLKAKILLMIARENNQKSSFLYTHKAHYSYLFWQVFI